LAARSYLIRFLADERGATAIEYGLICALVFLVVVTSITAFGNKTSSVMIRVSNTLSNVVG
jgi:pilus assembly protein Flp/PilA